MGTVLVPLSQGRFALIDAVDAERVLPYKWHVHRAPDNIRYAARKIKDPIRGWTQELMHCFILGMQSGLDIDHKNGDGLDNRRSNLRRATRSQNGANRGTKRPARSGFRGVYWKTRHKKWEAQCRVGGKLRYLGHFDSAEAAARAYDAAAFAAFGEFARLNFPISTDEEV